MPDFGVKRFDYVIKHKMYNIDFVVTNKDISDMLEQRVAFYLTMKETHILCNLIIDTDTTELLIQKC